MPRARPADRQVPEVALKKRPSQRRAQVTFDAIVDACARLLPVRGYAGVTTNHIADAAGVGIASLYEYFPGKDAIVAQVADRLVHRVIDRLGAAAPDILAGAPERAVHRWIELIHDTLRRERKLVAVFVYQVPYTNRLDSLRAVTPRLVELSRTLRRQAGGRIQLADETASIYLMVNLVSSTILQLILDPPPDISRGELLAALARRIATWVAGH